MKKIAVAAGAFFIALLGAWALGQKFYEVPVLMYHQVDVPSEEKGVYVSPENFERQMEFLKAHRYHVVPLENLIQDLKAGKQIPFKTVAITFDDGNENNFENAFPVLKKMNFPATIFMISENINRPGWLTEEDLKILDESGIVIGSHTANHAFLPPLAPEAAESEITRSKQKLEKILGHPITIFSYPAGGVTPEIEKMVEKAGYEGAVTTNYGKKPHDPYALHRIKVGDSSANLFNFLAKTSGFYTLGKKRVSYVPAENSAADGTRE